MEVIKKLGNNAAICKDSNGRELIAIGLGIGFPKVPYELTDLSKVDRTFYNVDSRYLSLFEDIDVKIFEISADVIDLATTMLSVPLKHNAVFTLADHLSFALVRMDKGIVFTTPISNELKDLYPVEVKVAKYTLKLLHKEMNVQLPESEIYAIAMNIINSEENQKFNNGIKIEAKFIEDVVRIIEKQMQVSIDKDSFNYSRFASHLQYLFKRKSQSNEISSANKKLFNILKNDA